MAQKLKAIKKQGKEETGKLREHIRRLETDLFCLWEYICAEGLTEEAREYLIENADKGIPFDLE